MDVKIFETPFSHPIISYFFRQYTCSLLFTAFRKRVDSVLSSLTFQTATGSSVNFIKFLGPILVIAMTIMEGVKTVTSNDKDSLSKFGKITIKRVIYAVLLYAFPAFVNFIIKFAFAGGTCGIH